MKYEKIINSQDIQTPKASEHVMVSYLAEEPKITMDNVWCFLNSLDTISKRIIADRLINQIEHKQTTYGLSDKELEAELSSYPPLDDAILPELTENEFHQMVRNMSHKPMKGIEKWL